MRPIFTAQASAVRISCLLASAAVAGLAALPAPTFAQSASAVLQGAITQTGTETTLNGVIVTIAESGQTAVTNAEGVYRFGNVPPGTYHVRYDYLGYPTHVETVTLGAGVVTRNVVLGAGGSAIVVVGQRAAQAEALNKQRAADNTRNVVSADQTGPASRTITPPRRCAACRASPCSARSMRARGGISPSAASIAASTTRRSTA